jgi:hypothetical protein
MATVEELEKKVKRLRKTLRSESEKVYSTAYRSSNFMKRQMLSQLSLKSLLRLLQSYKLRLKA